MNWDNITFRASSWGNLLTEPVTKAAKDAGELSVTCQKELVKIYNEVKYGRKKDLVTKQMQKGVMVEGDSILLFSMLEGVLYQKNEERMSNEWFSGHPDIYEGESITNTKSVWDIKSSWELDTFTPKLIEKLDTGYEAQLNCYYSLTGAQGGGLAYCLVSAPQSMVMDEKRKLLYSMDVVSEESPQFKKVAEELEKNMTFDDIPPEERCIRIPVPRNEELIQKMKAKVPRLRQWLSDFEKKHLNIYPKN